MIIPDANILLYAYNADASEHLRAAAWLEGLLSGPETVGLAWATLWAFLRLSTNARIFSNPKDVLEAFGIVKSWLQQPDVMIVQPGERHLELLQELVTKHKAAGPLLSDAALAALTIENGAVLASSDQDFRRFPGLRWVDPLE